MLIQLVPELLAATFVMWICSGEPGLRPEPYLAQIVRASGGGLLAVVSAVPSVKATATLSTSSITMVASLVLLHEGLHRTCQHGDSRKPAGAVWRLAAILLALIRIIGGRLLNFRHCLSPVELNDLMRQDSPTAAVSLCRPTTLCAGGFLGLVS